MNTMMTIVFGKLLVSLYANDTMIFCQLERTEELQSALNMF